MTPSLKELRAVTVLADERHFGRAADRLGMLQPQLSQIVARVEASAGFALFHRRPQVAPTIGGAAFIDTCRGILAEFEQGLERARHINAGQEGLIRVGFVGTVMLTDLPDRFAAYRERHPRIVFSFRETFSRALIEAVQAGSVDIAFVREREPGPDLAEHVVFREPFVAITRETGPQRESVSLRRLAEEPFILFPPERAPLLHDQVMHVCREQGFMPRVTHLADGWTAALALVRSGFGVTVGPASLRRMSWPGLSFHDLPGSSVRSTISMLWKESGLSPAGQGLVRLFSEDA